MFLTKIKIIPKIILFILKSKFRSAQTVCLRRSKFRSTSADRLSALTIYFKKILDLSVGSDQGMIGTCRLVPDLD